MAEIVITASGITEKEAQKILGLLRALRRKRRKYGVKDLSYTMITGGNRSTTIQSSQPQELKT